jgi:hypothetical protein
VADIFLNKRIVDFNLMELLFFFSSSMQDDWYGPTEHESFHACHRCGAAILEKDG